MKTSYKRYVPFALGIAFVLVLIMRFVFGWCNIWICLSGIGLIVVWQIASDFYDDNEDDTV